MLRRSSGHRPEARPGRPGEALRAGDLEDAVRLVATVRAYDAGHVDLPDTLARLMEESRLGGDDLARLLARDGSVADAAEDRGAGLQAAALDPGQRAARVAAGLFAEGRGASATTRARWRRRGASSPSAGSPWATNASAPGTWAARAAR